MEKLLASVEAGGKRHALGTRRRRGLSADLDWRAYEECD